jgi:hypothetical protein
MLRLNFTLSSMGELIVTAPNGKVTNLAINTQLDPHVLDKIIEDLLKYYAPTEEYIIDIID